MPPLHQWRPGHFERPIPAGYLESIASGQNRIVDPQIRALYQKLKLITQGDLLAPGRLRAILEMNLEGSGVRSPESEEK
jgi:arabinofuranosyltransferase